jgi:hypothetical protein
MNSNIKIVRLQSGEDIIANYLEDEENDTVLLDKPMHIILKRLPNNKTIMMMMPWLPVELIKENEAILYASDILSVFEPREDLVEHYDSVLNQFEEALNSDEDDDEDDSIDGEMEIEEIQEGTKRVLH